MIRYFIGLGSNLGDRLASVGGAVDELRRMPGFTLGQRSKPWETRPLGPGTAPFINAAIELHTPCEPATVLDRLLTIEVMHGRVRRERWGDRTLDLDLLCAFVDGRELRSTDSRLRLPHPGLTARDFVLRPLLDIDEQLYVEGRSCAAWLADIAHDQRTLMHALEWP